MSKIAIDLDSTLYDFETVAREGYLKLAEERNDKSLFRGAYHAWTEWRSPDDVCGHDVWMDVIGLCHHNDVIAQQTPFKGSVETCRALHDNGHELMYISNRATESTNATYAWLSTWDFPQINNLVCMMESKTPYLADCQYLIDDRPKALVEFVYDAEWDMKEKATANGKWATQNIAKEYLAKHEWNLDGREYDNWRKWHQSKFRRRAFGLTYPYNQALTDIPHIYLAPTWAGLSFYLQSKGLISEPAHRALEAA